MADNESDVIVNHSSATVNGIERPSVEMIIVGDAVAATEPTET